MPVSTPLSSSAANFPKVIDQPFNQKFEKTSPRVLVNVDGFPFIPKSYDLSVNVHGATDEATVVFPIKGYPDWTQMVYRGDDAGNADQPVFIQIYAGFPGDVSNISTSQLNLRFYGVLDQYTIRRRADETTFQCRSLAAPLVSNTITIGLKGGPGVNTTTAFIQQMATKYNLATTSNGVSTIQLAPGQTAGTVTDVLAQNFVAGIRNVGIWDLMLQCAQYDDVMLWVDEQGVLWYASPTGLVRNKVKIAYGTDLLDLEITHSPQFSKNVLVEARANQKRTKTSIVYRVGTNANADGTITTPSIQTVSTTQPIFGTNQSVSTTTDSTGISSVRLSSVIGGTYTGKAAAPAAYSGKERYVFNLKGALSPSQVAAYAQKMWRQISEHEFSVTMTLPVTKAMFGSINSQTQFNLTTGFQKANGAYWPRRIHESFDPKNGGWKFEIDAVNHEFAQGQIN
jgi:hypothetical protein